jgi:hypothetical protein
MSPNAASGGAHNNAVEQTAGSHSLAAAAHRERWAPNQTRNKGMVIGRPERSWGGRVNGEGLP